VAETAVVVAAAHAKMVAAVVVAETEANICEIRSSSSGVDGDGSENLYINGSSGNGRGQWQG
jgi:hypothetical protein